jgi:hypothetical protein
MCNIQHENYSIYRHICALNIALYPRHICSLQRETPRDLRKGRGGFPRKKCRNGGNPVNFFGACRGLSATLNASVDYNCGLRRGSRVPTLPFTSAPPPMLRWPRSQSLDSTVVLRRGGCMRKVMWIFAQVPDSAFYISRDRDNLE